LPRCERFREDQRCQGFSCPDAPLGCSDPRYCPKGPKGLTSPDPWDLEAPDYEIPCDTCRKRESCPNEGYPSEACGYECSHPDAEPVPETPSWYRCVLCGKRFYEAPAPVREDLSP
jgi:hypothetical protein